MRGADVALGACGCVVLGVLVAVGPGGLDSRLYWRASSATIQAARPERATPETSVLEASNAEVGAVRGTTEGPESIVDADSASPESTPSPDITPAGETFPPLAPELQERFRRAWFDGATEAELLNEPAAPAATEAQGATEAPAETNAPAAGVEQPAPQAEGEPAPAGVEAAPENVAPYVVNEVVDENVYEVDESAYPPTVEGYVPLEGEEGALDELVVVPRGALLPREYMGTDPRYDPFVNDARRNEGTSGPLRGAWTGGAWTGGATTGGAWTGGATTGAATRGGAWTGGAWSGGATTGGAWTGGAWTGGATTGGAWTGGAWNSP